MVTATASGPLLRAVPTSEWSVRLGRRVAVTDLIVLVWVVVGVQLVWLGFDEQNAGFLGSDVNATVSYVIVSVDRGRAAGVRSWKLRSDRAGFTEETLVVP